MAWFGSLVLVALLAAFNLYCMDTLMRMRADILVIRKAVAPGKEPFVVDDEGGEGEADKKPEKQPTPAERKATEWRRKRPSDNTVAAFFKGLGLV